MENNFKIEIISPERIIFSGDIKMVTLPSYEGDMSVLKQHISIITFLRPGIIRVQKNEENLFHRLSMSSRFFNSEVLISYFVLTKIRQYFKRIKF